MSSLSPTEKLGLFTNELYSGMGSVLYKVEETIHSIAKNNSTMKGLLKKIETNQTAFFQGIFATTCLYNLYQNPITFATGALVGIYASIAKESDFPSLQNNPIFSLTANDNFAAPKILACVTLVKACLGSSVLDTTFFRMFTGVIAGNSFYHSRNAYENDSYAKRMRSLIEMMESYINKAFAMFTTRQS